MKKAPLVFSAVALIPAYLYAIDGQMLINQATINALNGAPLIIRNPGSYKLSGSLTMNTSAGGNIGGIDVVIGIASSNVTLDLNGFTINVVNNIPNLAHSFYAIVELGNNPQFTGTTIRNGSITLTGMGTVLPVEFQGFHGIYMLTSTVNRVQDISVLTGGGDPSFVGSDTNSIVLGKHSLLRCVTLDYRGVVTCPSVSVETVGNIFLQFNGCAASLNAPF